MKLKGGGGEFARSQFSSNLRPWCPIAVDKRRGGAGSGWSKAQVSRERLGRRLGNVGPLRSGRYTTHSPKLGMLSLLSATIKIFPRLNDAETTIFRPLAGACKPITAERRFFIPPTFSFPHLLPDLIACTWCSWAHCDAMTGLTRLWLLFQRASQLSYVVHCLSLLELFPVVI
jgi:hypothetical protein